MNMQNLMAQAQRMQRDIMKKKEEVEKKEFTGKSELVTVTVNGKKDLVKVEFAKEVASDDLEALQDMIVIATNNANKEVLSLLLRASVTFPIHALAISSSVSVCPSSHSTFSGNFFCEHPTNPKQIKNRTNIFLITDSFLIHKHDSESLQSSQRRYKHSLHLRYLHFPSP